MWEQLAAQFAGQLGKGLGGAIGGAPAPFVGGNAQSAAYGTTLDGGGWVVNTGGGMQIASASPSRTSVDPVSAQSATPMQAGLGMVGAVALGLVALGLLLRRKGKR